jgi:hypothetical protein
MLDTVAMSPADDAHDAETHAGGVHAEDALAAHADDAHGTGHSIGHDHDEPGEPLGPVDVVAWAYALAGGALGVVTAAALFAASAG